VTSTDQSPTSDSTTNNTPFKALLLLLLLVVVVVAAAAKLLILTKWMKGHSKLHRQPTRSTLLLILLFGLR